MPQNSLLPAMTSGLAGQRSFLATPERIAVAGDWHADTEYAVAAVGHAALRDASVLVQLGDFGYNLADNYLDALEAALACHGITLGFVDGNHENFDVLLAYPIADDGLRYLRSNIVHLPRGFRWCWGQTRCVAVGGAYSIDRILRVSGRSWWPQEMITADQARLIEAAGQAEVIFCHDCPSGVAVPGAERSHRGFPDEEIKRSEVHRALLRSIVDVVQPIRLWHGHFHHRYRTILNGGFYRTVVDGLGKNGDPIDNNLVVVNLADLGSYHGVAHAEHPDSRSA